MREYNEKHEAMPASAETRAERVKSIEMRARLMLLEEEMRVFFRELFEEIVLEAPKSERKEALLNFKVDYIRRKLRFVELIGKLRDLIRDNPEFSEREFLSSDSLADFEPEDKKVILQAIGHYIKGAETVKDIVEQESPSEIFARITGHPPVQEMRFAVHGNVIIFDVHEKDFRALYFSQTPVVREMIDSGFVPKAFQPFVDSYKGVHAFYTLNIPKIELDESGEILELGGMIAVNLDYKEGLLDDAEREISFFHEQQHALHAMLYSSRKEQLVPVETEEDAARFFDGLLEGYLEEVRNEAIAYAITGSEIPRTEIETGGIYFYPSFYDLNRLKKIIGEQKFSEWKIEELWEKKVLKPFARQAKLIRKIGRMLGRLIEEEGKECEWQLHLFEIEPPETWSRLYKWLQDEEVQARLQA